MADDENPEIATALAELTGEDPRVSRDYEASIPDAHNSSVSQGEFWSYDGTALS
jgi:hypothetical protein